MDERTKKVTIAGGIAGAIGGFIVSEVGVTSFICMGGPT